MRALAAGDGAAAAAGGAKLPAVPVLLLAGTHDLSTPMEWAQAEAKLAPKGQLVTVPGAGHGTQSRGGPVARRAVERFLQG